MSRTTVSFVLNDAPGQSIPTATREAVLDAARQLGYTPSAAARMLRSGESRLVVCLAPEWQPSALMDQGMTALTKALRSRDYVVVLAKAGPDGLLPDLLWRSVTPAAVVAMYELPAAVRAQVEALRVPIYELWFHSSGDHAPADDLQNVAGRIQADHLIDQGAERLVFVAPADLVEIEIRDDRFRGVRAGAGARGLPEPELLLLGGLRGEERSALRARLSVTTGGRIGVCAFNDLHGVATILEARAAGRVVPDDILVVGVDDDPVAALVEPTLSSVRFDITDHMTRVAEGVSQLLDGNGDGYRGVAAHPEVVKRESS